MEKANVQSIALPYDRRDGQSIYHYAINLRGSTLRESSNADSIDDIRRNKGSFGSAIEAYYFLLDLNSDSAPDFKEAKSCRPDRRKPPACDR